MTVTDITVDGRFRSLARVGGRGSVPPGPGNFGLKQFRGAALGMHDLGSDFFFTESSPLGDLDLSVSACTMNDRNPRQNRPPSCCARC
jgi:hypothetical protein